MITKSNVHKKPTMKKKKKIQKSGGGGGIWFVNYNCLVMVFLVSCRASAILIIGEE